VRNKCLDVYLIHSTHGRHGPSFLPVVIRLRVGERHPVFVEELFKERRRMAVAMAHGGIAVSEEVSDSEYLAEPVARYLRGRVAEDGFKGLEPDDMKTMAALVDLPPR
jgi:hypothetical protein